MGLDTGDVTSIIVVLVTVIGGYLANRASSKAQIITSRTTAEEEAFVRARKFDTDTIARQDAEIEELREQNRLQKEELDLLRPLVHEVKFLRSRVSRLEAALTSHEKEYPNGEHDQHNRSPE